MTPEAKAYLAETMYGLNELMDFVTRMHEAEGWIDSLDVVADALAKVHSVQSRFHEFRRAYGDQVDPALMNRCLHAVDNALGDIPDLIRQIAVGLRMEASRG